MTQANTKKETTTSHVRLVVEVDGNAVGFLNLDLDRLWPLINHTQQETVPVEWMDAEKFDSIMREYPISSAEGLALMRLAEALLRVPDAETAIALTADQLGRADFTAEGDEGSPHRLLATLSSSAIVLAKRWLPEVGEPPGLLERLGAKTVVAATVRARAAAAVDDILTSLKLPQAEWIACASH